MKKVLAIILLGVSIYSCFMWEDQREIYLSGCNDSDVDIWFSFVDNRYEEVVGGSFYDAGITIDNYRDWFSYVESDSIKFIYFKMGTSWEENSPEGLRIRVWRNDVIQSFGWDRFLRENGRVSQLCAVEYVYSLSDLEQRAEYYHVHFPPDESMKSITMYPPYEEVIKKYQGIVGHSN